MELPRIPDLAAKQIVDSTRVFAEYLKAVAAGGMLSGSYFWKRTGPYEYLVCRNGSKLVHIGRRSPETEAQYKRVKEEQLRARERLKRLKAVVDVSARMNKATRAGSAPAQVIDVLRQLDEFGLTQKSLFLGSAVVHAYCQRAGVALGPLTDQRAKSPAAQHGDFQMLFDGPWESALLAVQSLQSVHRDHLEINTVREPSTSAILLDITFRTAGMARQAIKDTETPLRRQQLLLKAATSAQTVPAFEQVVIGKNGIMARIRAVDPQVFASLNRNLLARNLLPRQRRDDVRWEVELVETMLLRHLIQAKAEKSITGKLL